MEEQFESSDHSEISMPRKASRQADRLNVNCSYEEGDYRVSIFAPLFDKIESHPEFSEFQDAISEFTH